MHKNTLFINPRFYKGVKLKMFKGENGVMSVFGAVILK